MVPLSRNTVNVPDVVRGYGSAPEERVVGPGAGLAEAPLGPLWSRRTVGCGLGRARQGREHEQGQFASGPVVDMGEVAVSGGETLPQRFTFVAGNLARPNLEGTLADLDAGLRVRTQVEVPGRRAGGARVGGHDDERLAVGEVNRRVQAPTPALYAAVLGRTRT